MKRLGWMFMLTAVTALVIGCGAGGGGATPEATFEKYKRAMVDKNFLDVWDMLSEASQRAMGEDAKEKAEEAARSEGPGRSAVERQASLMDMTVEEMKTMDGKALFVGLMKMAAKEGKEEWEKLPRAQLARVERDADKAKVYVKVDGKLEADQPLPLVLEGRKWKIDMMSVK